MGSWNEAAAKNLRDSWKAALIRVMGCRRQARDEAEFLSQEEKINDSSLGRSRETGKEYDLRESLICLRCT